MRTNSGTNLLRSCIEPFSIIVNLRLSLVVYQNRYTCWIILSLKTIRLIRDIAQCVGKRIEIVTFRDWSVLRLLKCENYCSRSLYWPLSRWPTANEVRILNTINIFEKYYYYNEHTHNCDIIILLIQYWSRKGVKCIMVIIRMVSNASGKLLVPSNRNTAVRGRYCFEVEKIAMVW